MSKALKVILGILLFGLVASAVCVGAGYHWVENNKGRLMADAQQAEKEAKLYAPDHGADTCLDASIRKLRPDLSLTNQVMSKVFLERCLTLAKPAPDLCKGIPGRGHLLDLSSWSVKTCELHGMPGSQPCAQLAQGLATHCEQHSP